MKLSKKQRLLILDRAYDKAVRKAPLAELEERVLRDALQYSSKKAYERSRERSAAIRQHFGWDTAEGQAKWEEIKKEILDGKSI